ncbi:uncharacterized protein B0I36DRAFT_255596 [Microdochium trichocladiopsis]|uniref:ZIP zinc transporter-domain-containing protein n=1 Tax=Microdochium trichocladiopsis TaxID=1682393 RepID=A0A9P9BJB2_9PEZI|nr:uncharacterized protein B0I36DRAFT_255596 [Microdochium trichocladiopsis]KAH7014461.1 hypothetical protein B0I36DRAFT_255596 [Microdochium trichocladiopsis]
MRTRTLSVLRSRAYARTIIVLLILVASVLQLWKYIDFRSSSATDVLQKSEATGTPHARIGHLLLSPTPVTEGEHDHCHFHASIEHCAGPSHGMPSTGSHCEKVDRDYDIPTRLIAVVIVLIGSATGVFLPMILQPSATTTHHPSRLTIALKQCGTGVIISTAFVHLFTHANLMFTNECLADFNFFEGTTATIFMGGIFISFLVDLVAHSRSHRRGTNSVSRSAAKLKDEALKNVILLEAGIIFHSILIGITLVVAADGYFITLAAVITLHQMFEGLALGTRLASMKGASGSDDRPQPIRNDPTEPLLPSNDKFLLATCFALVTPLGMLLGIALLGTFNGNDPGTIIAIGTLDALSAGILAWFGMVEMWAHDWLLDGAEMAGQSWGTIVLGLGSLVLGMAMMSVLGLWA